MEPLANRKFSCKRIPEEMKKVWDEFVDTHNNFFIIFAIIGVTMYIIR